MKITDDSINTTKIVVSITCVYLAFMLHYESKSPQQDMNYVSAIGASFVPVALAGAAYWIARLSKSNYSKAIFLATAIGITAMSIAGMKGYSLSGKPKNFEQCMLEIMKGQDRAMYSLAAKECRRLHPQ